MSPFAISILIASRTAVRLTPKAFAPFRLIRQQGAGRELAVQNPRADILRHAAMQGFAHLCQRRG
jgi:hypothetical protein